ncbi:MAG: polar amino acid transport system substrate-binding protein [Glaciecola sp.]
MGKPITLIILTLLFIKPLYAGEAITINFGVTVFKPYSSIDESTGQCVGSAFEITKKLLEPYNIKINFSCAAPARVYRSLSTGTVDLSLNIKSTLALQNKVTFTTIPFEVLILNFYTNPDIRLVGNKIASIRGYDYSGFRKTLIQKGFEFVDVANAEDAIRIFANKRTKYLLSYEGPLNAYVENEKDKAELLTLNSAQSELLTAIPTYYAIGRASPHHDLLVKVFEQLEAAAKGQQYHLDAFK